MGRLDNAKTYNCPLRFTITRCKGGWTYLVCEFNGTILDFCISYCLGDQPSSLIQAVYSFNTYEDNYDGIRAIEVEREDGISDLDGNRWDHVVVRTLFTWEEEPRSAKWRISLDPKDYGLENFPLDITIDRWDIDDTRQYNFTVMYRDLCYAVAKCFTDVLKEHGVMGYHYGTYTDDINIRELLIIKAYALGILSNYTSLSKVPEYKYDFTYEEELQLLMMDM